MRILKFVGGALAILVAVVLVNTWRVPPAAPPPAAPALLPVDAAAAAARLGAALRIATVSHEDRSRIDYGRFDALAAQFERDFPRVHRALTRERIGKSLLYTWPGRDAAARPILLLSHMDVVPVEPGTEGRWTHPPFSGAIADGFVWGRGAMDDKASVVGWLEAVELLLAQDHRPARTVYFAFGHDEEIGGQDGARQIAAQLEARGVKAEFSLDEGGVITRGIVGGVERPVASIMVGEKGYASYRLSLRGEGGHSSLPPPRTHVGRLAAAVARLEQNPMPARLTAPVAAMLDSLAPEMPFGRRLVIANRWLLEPVLLRSLAGGRVTNALIRTTTAPTVFHAGVKDNVLPSEAHAVVNFRLLPGDTLADVEDHIRRVIADPDIELACEGSFCSAAPPVADPAAPAFEVIAGTVREVFPDAVVSSGLVTGATDSRHYEPVRGNGYHFAPLVFGPEDLARVHGTDERIGVEAYADLVRFYARVLVNGDASLRSMRVAGVDKSA